MAFDELVSRNLGLWGGYLGASWLRFVRAAMQARAGAYNQNLLFNDLVAQFVAGWDVWDELTAFTGHPVTPTVVIQGDITPPGSTMIGLRGEATVPHRLTNAAFAGTVLELFDLGPAQFINAHGAGYHVVTPVTDPPPPPPFGDLDGQLTIQLDADPPAAGTYRGLVLIRPAGTPNFEPLAWLVVQAD
jgi:hypothetical protein